MATANATLRATTDARPNEARFLRDGRGGDRDADGGAVVLDELALGGAATLALASGGVVAVARLCTEGAARDGVLSDDDDGGGGSLVGGAVWWRPRLVLENGTQLVAGFDKPA